MTLTPRWEVDILFQWQIYNNATMFTCSNEKARFATSLKLLFHLLVNKLKFPIKNFAFQAISTNPAITIHIISP